VSTLRSRSEFDINGEEQVLPSNNTFGTLEEDAFRRDLTINALFYEIETHTIIDYTGGVRDLDQGVIRMVGDPDRRFTRDPVRMLRVVRHAARTGFGIEEETFAALRRHREELRLCPPSRIRDEVLKDLQSGACRAWAEMCMKSGIWPALFPLYDGYMEGEQGEKMQRELLNIFAVLDRLHARGEEDEAVKIPEPLLFAALLLPWACARFKLPETNVRGPGFHRLSSTIREDVDCAFGEPFNVQRMAKESLATLLINLSTFHHARSKGEDPKWLKKKAITATAPGFSISIWSRRASRRSRLNVSRLNPRKRRLSRLFLLFRKATANRRPGEEAGSIRHSAAQRPGSSVCGAHRIDLSEQHAVFTL
jgi:poly(A) polymerase